MAVINKTPKTIDYQLQLMRQFAAPLDGSSVYYSLDAAKAYATTSAIAYVGQLLSVVDETNNKTEVYKIKDMAGNLEIVGLLPDAALSTTSTNPIQNKVVATKFAEIDTSIISLTNSLASHTHNWDQINSKPSYATRWPSWSEVTDKPATFAPAAHSHDYLPLSGGTMSGELKAHGGLSFQSTTTEVTDSEYYLTMDAFASGGAAHWIRKSNLKSALGVGINADYPTGFSSRASSATWGNQTGSFLTCWEDSTGGSVQWRRDNPNNGQCSLIIDGTVYVNEGNDRVYCSSYKPSPADIGAAAEGHTHSQYLTAHQSLSNYVTLNGAQTISGYKTFTGNIKIGTSSNGEILFGDGNYVYIKEYQDDCLIIKADKGLKFRRGGGNASYGSETTTYYDVLVPTKSGTIALTSQIPTFSYSNGVLTITTQ